LTSLGNQRIQSSVRIHFAHSTVCCNLQILITVQGLVVHAPGQSITVTKQFKNKVTILLL